MEKLFTMEESEKGGYKTYNVLADDYYYIRRNIQKEMAEAIIDILHKMGCNDLDDAYKITKVIVSEYKRYSRKNDNICIETLRNAVRMRMAGYRPKVSGKTEIWEKNKL
jgi:hypothetical protein